MPFHSRTQTLRSIATIGALLIVFGAWALVPPRPQNAQAETRLGPPAAIKDGYATLGLVGWRKIETPEPDIAVRYTPDAAPDAATLWLTQRAERDPEAAFLAAAAAHGLEGAVVTATAPVAKARLLDSGGFGTAVMGAGRRNGVETRMIALIVYGSLDDSPRLSGVHAFAAAPDVFEAMGGWVAPAVLWLDVDAATIGPAGAQGARSPEEQVATLAAVADIWMQWAFDTFVQLNVANLRALNNARVSAICVADPACTVRYDADGTARASYE